MLCGIDSIPHIEHGALDSPINVGRKISMDINSVGHIDFLVKVELT